ncbi:hypothetical protein [Phenylobacterium sp.]|uniref:hypothetical protein n=1 Tax=Phenylobacterium sp. TaxID=1871053 RepID=UPI0030F438D3
MADAKKTPELSSAYYSHKRTTLLYSGGLLLFSLPGVTVKLTNSLGSTIEGLNPAFALLVLALASTYYFVNFCLIWTTEAVAYSRAMDLGEKDVVKSLEQFMVQYATMEERLGQTAELVVTEMNNPALIAAMEAGVAFDQNKVASAVQEPVERFKELALAWSNDHIQEQIRQQLHAPETHQVRDALAGVVFTPAPEPRHEYLVLGTQILDNLRRQWGPLQTTVTELNRARLDASGKLAGMEMALREMNSAMKAIRSNLLLGPLLRRALLVGMDLAAPLLLYVVAGAHFIGHNWWVELPDLPTILGF